MTNSDRRPSVPVVFVSSTWEDLGPYRAAARDAANAANCLPRMMEYFAASGDPTLASSLAKITGADVVVAIVAHRYGSVPTDQPPGPGKCLTWLECEHAVQNGAEILAFIVDEKAPWPEDQRDDFAVTAAIREGRATQDLFEAVQRRVDGLAKFKAWLEAQGTRATFTAVEELRGKVFQALHEWRARRGDVIDPAQPVDPSHYLRELQNRTSFIDIKGLQVGAGKAYRFPIEELFMQLTTTIAGSAAGPGDIPAGTRRSRKPGLGEREQEAPASALLHTTLSHGRLVLVGDPGAGKTTFLRRVAHALCQTRLGDDATAAEVRLGVIDAPFPIFVRLASLAEHARESRSTRAGSRPTLAEVAAWLPHFLATVSQAGNLGLDEEFFLGQLKRGPCLLLLDGLDEAADRTERASLCRLIENVSSAYPACRIVVTSRPGAYIEEAVLPGFAHAQVEPLDDNTIQTFLGRWCTALYAGSPADASAHRDELVSALRSRPEIRRMARNPVMLTALAVVHWNERRLPEQRADLYESIIKWLARARDQKKGRPTAEQAVALLQELALAMQRDPRGRQVQVFRHWAAEAIASEWRDDAEKTRIANAERFLGEEEVDSGIIVGRGNELRFWHLTFQEFLAAKAIAGRPEREQRHIVLGPGKRLYLPEWREVLLLLAGVLHEQGRPKVDGFVSAMIYDLTASATLADKARLVGLVGAVLRDLKPLGYETADARYRGLLDEVMGIFDKERSRAIVIETRIDAANALGQAGDPRLDPDHRDRWIAIEGGAFWMGAQKMDRATRNFDAEAHDDESPVHEVRLEPFRIARYPVTVVEYQRFVGGGGYAESHWWPVGGFGRWEAPQDWDEQTPFPNRPVVGVSWFEAAAYAAWAGGRLPTEAEWERAARSTDARKFPWENEAPDSTRLNYDSNIGRPTPVGIYPLGDTADGISDMAGNVWEWCQDWKVPYVTGSGHTGSNLSKKEGTYRVVRGGSWNDVARIARAACRGDVVPENRGFNLGFRVVGA